jgi:hypothetical protein
MGTASIIILGIVVSIVNIVSGLPTLRTRRAVRARAGQPQRVNPTAGQAGAASLQGGQEPQGQGTAPPTCRPRPPRPTQQSTTALKPQQRPPSPRGAGSLPRGGWYPLFAARGWGVHEPAMDPWPTRRKRPKRGRLNNAGDPSDGVALGSALPPLPPRQASSARATCASSSPCTPSTSTSGGSNGRLLATSSGRRPRTIARLSLCCAHLAWLVCLAVAFHRASPAAFLGSPRYTPEIGCLPCLSFFILETLAGAPLHHSFSPLSAFSV